MFDDWQDIFEQVLAVLQACEGSNAGIVAMDTWTTCQIMKVVVSIIFCHPS